jgi:hypothetical protein
MGSFSNQDIGYGELRLRIEVKSKVLLWFSAYLHLLSDWLLKKSLRFEVGVN